MEKAILYAQDEIKEGKSAEDVAGSFTTRVAKSISKGRGQVKCGSAGNEAYSEFLRVDAGDSSAVSTGFNKLDLILGGGFRPGALYVLAARPGVGKSAFAVQLAYGIARHGLRVAYASPLRWVRRNVPGGCSPTTVGLPAREGRVTFLRRTVRNWKEQRTA